MNDEAFQGREVVPRASKYCMLPTAGLALNSFILIEDMAGAVL